MNAVIDQNAFNSIKKYIEYAKNSEDAEIISGGNYDDSSGYFIEPTTILTTNPKFKTMQEEIFGPVLTIYIYDSNELDKTIDLINDSHITIDLILYKLYAKINLPSQITPKVIQWKNCQMS